MEIKLNLKDISSIILVVASVATAYYEYQARIFEVGAKEEQLGKAITSIANEECDKDVRLSEFLRSIESNVMLVP